MRFKCRSIFVFAVLTTAMPLFAMANTISIESSRDASLFQNNVDNSDGGGNGIFAGTNGSSSPRRGLIGFDVAGNLPRGAIITGSQLTLTLAQVAGSGGGGPGGGGTPTIELHRLSADWGEGTNQKQNPPNNDLSLEGQGAPANTGDATWNARFYSTTTPTLWTMPGGDFSPTVSASKQIVGTTTGVSYTWGSTAGMVGDLQSWLNTPSSNFGWILVNTDEADLRTFRAFYSREAATETFHPQLQITYSLLLGDVNQDGHVNAADILAMEGALSNTQSYKATEKLTDPQLFLEVTDVNQDGNFTNADLQALLGYLKTGHGSVDSVPEPSGFVLACMAMSVLWLRRR